MLAIASVIDSSGDGVVGDITNGPALRGQRRRRRGGAAAAAAAHRLLRVRERPVVGAALLCAPSTGEAAPGEKGRRRHPGRRAIQGAAGTQGQGAVPWSDWPRRRAAPRALVPEPEGRGPEGVRAGLSRGGPSAWARRREERARRGARRASCLRARASGKGASLAGRRCPPPRRLAAPAGAQTGSARGRRGERLGVSWFLARQPALVPVAGLRPVLDLQHVVFHAVAKPVRVARCVLSARAAN